MKSRYFYPCQLLCIIAIITFIPSLFNEFQREWDDTWQVLENPFISDTSFQSIIHHFSNFYHGQYSPVNTLCYILTHQLFGFYAPAFHAFFLLVHIASALLVNQIGYKIIRRLKPGYTEKRTRLFSFCVALLFAIHPLQVEAVAWISASKVIMYGFFVLLASYTYIMYLESHQNKWLVFTVIAYLMALGSKEQAIIFPLNLFVFDYCYNRFKGTKLNLSFVKSRLFTEKLPFFVVALAFWYFSQQNNLGSFDSQAYPFQQRFLIGSHSFIMYIFRFIAPVKLYYYYFFPVEPGGTIPFSYWIYPVLVVLVFMFFYQNLIRQNKLMVAGFLFFLINLLLALHILPMPRSYATADRFMYLSIIGIALMTVWFLQFIIVRVYRFRKLFRVLFVFCFVFFAVHSFYRTTQWKNSDTIKHDIKELLERSKAENLPEIKNPIEER